MSTISVFLLAVVLGAGEPAIAGRVVDADDNPVAEAEVFLVRNNVEFLWLQPAEYVQTRTDQGGRFAFDQIPEGWSAAETRSVAVLAYKPDMALGGSNAQGDAMTIRLGRAGRHIIQVQDPEGRALPGATVRCVAFGPMQSYKLGAETEYAFQFQVRLPEPLGKLLAVNTNEEGRCEVAYLADTGGVVLQVDAERFGVQEVNGFTPRQMPRTIRLSPVGRVTGRVVAGEAAAAAKRTVFAYSFPVPAKDTAGSEVIRPYSRSITVTDDEGQFEIPALTAGRCSLLVLDNDTRWKQPATENSQQTLHVEGGKTVNTEITLQRAIAVEGQVVDADTGEGIGGVQIAVPGAFASRNIVTDARGKYSVEALTGYLFIQVVRVPEPYLMPFERGIGLMLTAQSPKLTEIRLHKARTLSGQVVDEQERPVAGATVSATFVRREGLYSSLGFDSATSDAKGQFILKQLWPGAAVELEAQTADQGLLQRAVAAADVNEMKLTVSPRGVAYLAGRVVDAQGSPLAGVEIQILESLELTSGYAGWNRPLELPLPLVTDAQGEFRTPRRLPSTRRVALRAAAEGYLPAETALIKISGAEEIFRAADIVLPKLGRAVGVVVDAEGRPIAGAKVWSFGPRDTRKGSLPARTMTDAQGAFDLRDVDPRAVLLFAWAEGYRIQGAELPTEGSKVELRLSRVGAPPLEPPLACFTRTREEKLLLMKDLLAKALPPIQRENSNYFITQAARRLAPLDGALAWALVRESRADVRVGIQALLGDADEALAAAAEIKDPYSRALNLCQIAAAATNAETKQAALAEALLAAKQITQPDHRTYMLGAICEQLYDAGLRDKAREVAEEGRKLAESLALSERPAFARGTMAEALAPFDPDAAFALVDGLEDNFSRNRHLGNIAHELAAIDPAQAERFLKALKAERSSTPYEEIRVVYRMAAVDVDRARRIADAIQSPYGFNNAKAHAYGVIAMALAKKDAAQARRLLREAFEMLPERNDSYQPHDSPFGTGFILLLFAEQIDARLGSEYFWRVAALHPGPSVQDFLPAERMKRAHENAAHLALLLGVFNRLPETRRKLMAPVFEDWEKSPITDRGMVEYKAAFAAMALVDPPRAIALVEKLEKQLAPEQRRYIPQPWMPMADVFCNDGRELSWMITENIFHRWPIDKEDF